MSKSTTPAHAGTDQPLATNITKPYRPEIPADQKTRTRAPKQLTPADIIIQIERIPLAQKLAIRDLINGSIEADRQRLQEQLKLIQGNTPEPQKYDH